MVLFAYKLSLCILHLNDTLGFVWIIYKRERGNNCLLCSLFVAGIGCVRQGRVGGCPPRFSR